MINSNDTNIIVEVTFLVLGWVICYLLNIHIQNKFIVIEVDYII